jgi:16S rRNA (guanine(966)-N(2))-methyltransferase RsmD
LDLFAGTGNLSLEALSRGAARATLVDCSPRCAEMIRDNLDRLDFADRATLLALPVTRALRALARRREQFDLIFLDPPYGEELVPPTLRIIAQHKLLRANGMVVAEHAARDIVAQNYGSLMLTDSRRYGDTALSFFKQKSADSLEQGSTQHGQ